LSKVRIRTPSRIHLGFYNIRYKNVMFGSIGLTVNRPFYDITFERCDEIEVMSSDSSKIREIFKITEKVLDAIGLPGGLRMRIRSYIDRHIGLGSTTQLLMAIISAVDRLYGIKVDPWTLFKNIGRRNVSGVGVAGFLKGGFIVDSGWRDKRPPQVIMRHPFPRDWRIILIVPKRERGFSEDVEERYLMPKNPSPDLRRELLEHAFLGIIPGVVNKDFKMFTYHLEMLDRALGKYYEDIQGGRYLSRHAQDIVSILKDLGGRGIGQSSWGPTIYSFFESEKRAIGAYKALKKKFDKLGLSVDVIICKGQNRGAIIWSEL